MQPLKSVIASLMLLMAALSSCKKDNVDNTITKAQLLTGKVWIYQSYYINNNTTPILYYQRDRATGNYANYDKNRLVYNADGTYTEISQYGEIITGIWKFINNETEVQVSNPRGTFNSKVVLLDAQYFNWQTTSDGGVLCKMIVQ